MHCIRFAPDTIPYGVRKKSIGMVLVMLDVENFKTMLQCEVNHREESKAAWEHYRTSNDSYLETVYEKMYIKYRSRYNAMCDILYEMGYLVFINDDNTVRVEKRSNSDNLSVDEIPF